MLRNRSCLCWWVASLFLGFVCALFTSSSFVSTHRHPANLVSRADFSPLGYKLCGHKLRHRDIIILVSRSDNAMACTRGGACSFLFSLFVCFLCCVTFVFFFVLSVASPPGGHDCGITTAVDKTRKTRLTKAGRRRQTG